MSRPLREGRRMGQNAGCRCERGNLRVPMDISITYCGV